MTPLFSIRKVSLASLQSWRSTDTNAGCKQALNEFNFSRFVLVHSVFTTVWFDIRGTCGLLIGLVRVYVPCYIPLLSQVRPPRELFHTEWVREWCWTIYGNSPFMILNVNFSMICNLVYSLFSKCYLKFGKCTKILRNLKLLCPIIPGYSLS